MNAFDTVSAIQPDKGPDNSTGSDRPPAPVMDTLFKGRATDFFSTFLHLSHLHEQIKAGKVSCDERVVHMIAGHLLKQAYDHQKQGYFLYREAAETLADCIQLADSQKTARQALEILIQALTATSGDAHRAVAGALGTLPLPLKGATPYEEAVPGAPIVRYGAVLRRVGLEKEAAADIVGRSLVIRYPGSDCLLVLKMAREGDTPGNLQRESDWMSYLRARKHAFVRRFDIPEPIKIAGATVFRLIDLPATCLPSEALHPAGYAIGFKTTRAYYDYPNESCPARSLGEERFQEVMCRNAWILGRLASMGIFHGALIPLFHNRTQRGRRDDQGAYEWIRAGRLDRWLHSCEHPNIGASGVRDFEHLEALDGKGGRPYRSMGKHFISMLLVSGSYFRKKDPGLAGLDADGRPVDARKLFDKEVLKKTVHGIFQNYYTGFAGASYCYGVPFDMDALVEGMIEEMGVDRHMEETIRVADQQALTDRAFRAFLLDRGAERAGIASFQRGIADIVIHSGPHLGAFNAGISIPELIEASACMAAVCVAGKYWQERYGENQDSRDRS
ncbi:MAG: SidJ-related pseudokinase [Thermodesulfobacteriota bacterium]